MIRKSEFTSPIGIWIGHLPRASLKGHLSVISLVFIVVFLIEGDIQFILVENFLIENFVEDALVVEMVGMDVGEGLTVVIVMVVIGGDFIVIEVVDEDYLMNNLALFGAYHRLGLDHQS